MPENKTHTTKLIVETSEFEDAMKDMTDLTQDFGRMFTQTIKTAVVSGTSLEDSLRSIALRISGMALDKAIAPLESMFSSFVGSLANSAIGSSTGSSAPQGIGLQSNQAPSNISFHVNTPDVASFKKSEGQISAMLTRTVSRGQRKL